MGKKKWKNKRPQRKAGKNSLLKEESWAKTLRNSLYDIFADLNLIYLIFNLINCVISKIINRNLFNKKHFLGILRTVVI